MNIRHLFCAMMLTSAVPLASTALAAESTEQSITAPETHNREIEVGDKAPDQYKREDAAIHDWKAKGLPAPEKESHWVKMADHYVLIQTTNGVVLAIRPAS